MSVRKTQSTMRLMMKSAMPDGGRRATSNGVTSAVKTKAIAAVPSQYGNHLAVRGSMMYGLAMTSSWVTFLTFFDPPLNSLPPYMQSRNRQR